MSGQSDEPNLADPDVVARPEAVLLLTRIGRELDRRITAALGQWGFKPRQAYILSALAARGPIGQRHLGAMLDLDHSFLVTLLNPMESDKLIERRRSSEDRRRHDVVITPAGRGVLKRAMATIDGVQADALSSLDDADADDLQRALRVIHRTLVAEGALDELVVDSPQT